MVSAWDRLFSSSNNFLMIKTIAAVITTVALVFFPVFLLFFIWDDNKEFWGKMLATDMIVLIGFLIIFEVAKKLNNDINEN